MNASLIVGPLVGGMLIGVVGAHTVFALNACTFLLSAILIGRLPQGVSQSNKSVGPARPMCGRWTAILREPGRRSLIAITALSYAAFGVTLVADLPLVDHFGAGALGYALLTTLWGVGAVLGSRLATRIDARHETLAVLCGTAAMGLALGSIAAMPNLTGAVAVGTIGGLGSGIAFTPWFSLLQRATDDSERGTAFAIAETFEQMAFVVGMVVAGVAVGVLGPQLTLCSQPRSSPLRRSAPSAWSAEHDPTDAFELVVEQRRPVYGCVGPVGRASLATMEGRWTDADCSPDCRSSPAVSRSTLPRTSVPPRTFPRTQ